MINARMIKERVDELNAASEAYYNSGNTIMSDAEFDFKLEELKKWEDENGTVLSNSPTHNVGSVVLKNIKEITHKTPMLSLDKCHSTEEIVKFAKNHSLVGSIKADGISCRLIYEDGYLVRAESRGNGIIGNDITESAMRFRNIPLHISKKGTYVIDGEALIKLDDFESINKNGEYKNSRNLTAGTLSTLDTSVVKRRKLFFYAWEVVEGFADTNSFSMNLEEANLLGFNVIPFTYIATFEFNNLDRIINSFIDFAKENNIPQDGVVFKFDDVKYGKSLGRTEKFFRNGIAWKEYNDFVETKLKNIEFTMGKTGVLTPVAIFDPVEIEGSVVERATLHNISMMRETMSRAWKGQKLGIYKANKIIPAVRWAEEFDSNKFNDLILDVSYIHIPDKCPICGHPTKIIKENETEVLVCDNPNCQGKLLGKLSHAVSRNALDIEGLSESTLDKFICLGWLRSIRDIYYLKIFEREIKILQGFGLKSSTKLFEAIEESRHTTLDKFLYALSIPLLGRTASKAIAHECDGDFDKFFRIMNVNHAKYFNRISGIGNALTDSMEKYFNKQRGEIYDLAQEFTFDVQSTSTENKTLSGKTFVITGSLTKFANRDELKSKIESLGGKVSGSVSAKTEVLINNDIESNSSKNKKAKQLGVPIVTEDEFIEKYLGDEKN